MATAVAFDILFDSTTTNDPSFLQAVRNHGRVIVGARFTPVGLEGSISFWPLKLPFEELQHAAPWGVSELTETDEVVRQHYRIARHSTNARLAAAMAALASSIPQRATRPSDCPVPGFIVST